MRSRTRIADASHLSQIKKYWQKNVKNRKSLWWMQRFGQYVYNFYVFDHKPWPELVNETDTQKAYDLILKDIYQTAEVIV